MEPDRADAGRAWRQPGLAENDSAKNQPTRLWHLTGVTWSQVTPGFGKHLWLLTQLAAVPHSGSVWGVGAVRSGKHADGLIAIAGPAPR